MKKLLVTLLIMAMSTTLLIGCGGNNNASSGGDANVNQEGEATDSFEEESDMDLSIYPSKNIEAYNGVIPEFLTHDEMYARVEPMIANTEVQEFDGSIIHTNANGDNVYCEFMDDGVLSTLFFSIYDENGTMVEEYYYDAKGDTKPRQVRVWDVNGQEVYELYDANAFTVYDYHANGALAHEVSYRDGVLEDDTTYNENGDELIRLGYRDGVERYKTENTYNDKGLLNTEESYYEGCLEYRREYSYTSNDAVERIDSYREEDGKRLHSDYEIYSYLEDGTIETVKSYGLTEETMHAFYVEGIEPTEDKFVLKTETEYYENGNPKIEKAYVNVNGEDKLERETEYFETGYRKLETLYAPYGSYTISYSNYGNYTFYDAVKIVTEFHEIEYGEMVSKCTAYDEDGVPVGEVEYDMDGNIISGKEFSY